MKYRLVYTRRVQKDLRKLDKAVRSRIGKTLLHYRAAPLKQAEKLADEKLGMYRFRIGDYRVVFDIEGGVIMNLKNRLLTGVAALLLSLAVAAGCATVGGKLSGAGISDSALAECVHNSRYESVEDVTRLKCEDAGIEDISGIGRFYNLKELQLSGNYIADIAPLASLKNLRVLNLDLSPVLDLRSLASLTSLESLSIMEGFVKHVEPLAALTRLTNLDLGDNLVIDVTPLSMLTRLVTLDLRGNHVKKGVATLASLKNAKRIVLTRNINVPYDDLGALIKALGTDTVEWERDSQNPWAGLAD